jgi:hypothetical protein
MATTAKKLASAVKTPEFLTLLGILVIGIAFSQFSTRKGSNVEGNRTRGYNATSNGNGKQITQGGGVVRAANPAGQNERFAAVHGVSTSAQGLPPSCVSRQVANPSELLPRGGGWASLNPQGESDLQNVNLLKAGYHAGINTVGNTLRNANLQVRSEPPNPQTKVSPWLNTTIAPDLMRVPLEIGCGPQ